MDSLLEIQEKIFPPRKPLSKYATLTARYREAFGAIQEGMSIRAASKFYEIKRKRLVLRYKAFEESRIDLDEYKFVTKKKGRRFTLSPAGLSSLKIAAHSLDSIGRPLSTSSLNLMIQSIAHKEGTGRAPHRASLQRWRRRLGMPKKTVRNGPGTRKKKSESHYVEDYFKKLTSLVTRFKIKKEFMFVFTFLCFFFICI
jgi:hypothetical protein